MYDARFCNSREILNASYMIYFESVDLDIAFWEGIVFDVWMWDFGIFYEMMNVCGFGNVEMLWF